MKKRGRKIGHFVSEETRKKISIGHKGKILSQITRNRMSKAKSEKPTIFWLGKKMSEEHKKKMSLSHKGKPNTGHFKKGSTHDDTWRELMRTKIGGSNNYHWNGGQKLHRIIRGCYRYRQWRSDVFTRDDFTCQMCDVHGGYLEADHIKMFSSIIRENNIRTIEEAITCEELWNINNGRTLCRPCHEKTPTYARKIKKVK